MEKERWLAQILRLLQLADETQLRKIYIFILHLL